MFIEVCLDELFSIILGITKTAPSNNIPLVVIPNTSQNSSADAVSTLRISENKQMPELLLPTAADVQSLLL